MSLLRNKFNISDTNYFLREGKYQSLNTCQLQWGPVKVKFQQGHGLETVTHDSWNGGKTTQIWVEIVTATKIRANTKVKYWQQYGSLFNAWNDWFSLRILVAGERCDVTGEYLKEAPHLNKKYNAVISYWTLVREFCIVNRECSNLCCIMNTPLFKIHSWVFYTVYCTPSPPPPQAACIIVQLYYWTV